MTNRIKRAIFNRNYSPGYDDSYVLHIEPVLVEALECTPIMAKYLYCPECLGQLKRVPRRGNVWGNKYPAGFRHHTSDGVKCSLRCADVEMVRKEKIHSESERGREKSRVLVTDFQSHFIPSRKHRLAPRITAQVNNFESEKEGVRAVFISGEKRKLTSECKSVESICNDFVGNYYRDYKFPGSDVFMPLCKQLNSVAVISGEVEEERLYFAQISYVEKEPDKKSSINQVELVWKRNKSFKDLKIKVTRSELEAKGIAGAPSGRYVLVWGKVFINGAGLAFKPTWGEYALLPDKYEALLLKEGI